MINRPAHTSRPVMTPAGKAYVSGVVTVESGLIQIWRWMCNRHTALECSEADGLCNVVHAFYIKHMMERCRGKQFFFIL